MFSVTSLFWGSDQTWPNVQSRSFHCHLPNLNWSTSFEFTIFSDSTKANEVSFNQHKISHHFFFAGHRLTTQSGSDLNVNSIKVWLFKKKKKTLLFNEQNRMQIHLSSVKWPLLIDFGQNIELLYTQTWWGLFFDFVGVVHGSQLSQANWNFVLGPQETKPKEETENK